MGSTPHVEVLNLCKEYSGRMVLDNVSFSVNYGEVLALIGPNGAGKTTLLRILDLLDEPTEGEVWLEGARVDYSRRDKHLLRRRIGLVPQKTILFNASVFDNVAYGLKIRKLGAAEIKRRVMDALEIVQLRGFEDRNALKLSGGEMQRVSLAQALVTEPPLLLLDEPTSNLDPKSTSIIEEALSYVNRNKKTTIIMATHDVLQVENLANRIAMLNEGKIVKIGSFSDIFGRISEDLAKYTRLENIFSGISRITEDGVSAIDVGNGLKIEATFKRAGNVRVYIPPESIIVLTRRVTSSARNNFAGRVTQISDLGDIVRLKIRVKGEREFTAQITRKSFEEMALNVGSEVYIAFKASSVQLI